MNPKGLTPGDEKSPLPPFFKGGFQSPPLEKGDLGGFGFHGKSFWWHRYLTGAAHRLEACATNGGPPQQIFQHVWVGQGSMRNCLKIRHIFEKFE